MRVTVFGVGAIGGFVGTRLAQSGCDVSAIARGATAAALRTHGWRLQSGDTRVSVPARVAESASELGPQELVVVAVKGPALPSVAAAVAPLLGRDTMVMTAMNGVPWWFFQGFGGEHAGMRLASIDPDGVIAKGLPAPHIVGCVVHASCSTPEPGVTRHHVGQRLIIGEPRGGDSPRVRALAEALSRASFDVEVSSCIQRDVWYKLWGNMTMNPVSALTGALTDAILDDTLVRGFVLGCMAEAAEIGARIGCPIAQSGEERLALTRELGGFRTSMLQDADAGRAIELDALVTAVHEIAGRIGVDAPNIAALLGLTRLMARGRGLYPC